jgi:hypothetical protein
MSPEERKRRHLESQRTEKVRKLRSTLTSELMADPERRAHLSEVMREKWKDQEYRDAAIKKLKRGPRIADGLTKTERYRLKDVEAYRKKKRDFARTPAERAKRVAYMRKWREKNRERHNELARESHKRNGHKHKDRNINSHLMRSFGITLEQKRAMVVSQGGVCLICLEPFKSARSTHVDHCHSTKRVRGILCHRCNTKLGWFERYSDVVKNYLEQN